jgi:outer membrane autotransporter protein
VGVLTINGNYTQSSTGILKLDVGGTQAGTSYDQLHISGTATLGGTITVNLSNGYTPVSGSTFTLLTFGSSSGTFSSISTPGWSPTPHYDSGDFRLVALADEPVPVEEDVPPVLQVLPALPERSRDLLAWDPSPEPNGTQPAEESTQAVQSTDLVFAALAGARDELAWLDTLAEELVGLFEEVVELVG